MGHIQLAMWSRATGMLALVDSGVSDQLWSGASATLALGRPLSRHDRALALLNSARGSL